MKKTSVSSFESNRDIGLYFWRSGSEPDETQFSSHPHPLLRFHCKQHNWWSDKKCPSCSQIQGRRNIDTDNENVAGSAPEGESA
jgi:hypothetical protein